MKALAMLLMSAAPLAAQDSWPKDTVYGMALVIDTVPVIMENGGTVCITKAAAAVLVPSFSVESRLFIVDGGEGKEHPAGHCTEYFRLTDCERIPTKRVLLFKAADINNHE